MTARPSAEGLLATRLVAFAQARRLLLEAAVLTIAVVIFLASVLPNLANHPAITDDEMWVFSSAYKIATEGVFGADMFAGFYNADERYYFNMPGQHFAVAASFKLLGAGVVQARLVGVIYGLATILLTYLLARRVYGAAAAALAVGLLLFLRLNMGFDTGLPLQELAANMRYDLAPVPFLLGGCLLLLGGPSLARSVAAGALFGLAVLFQFYAAFVFVPALLFLWIEALPARDRLRLIGGLIGAAALVGLPYGVYILSDLDDFRGQTGTLDDRAGFDRPGFYLDNLLDEPDRFLRPLAFKEIPRGADPAAEPRFLGLTEMLTRRPSAKLAVLAGLPLALAYAFSRARQRQNRGDRLLFLCLAGLVLQFALFESAKLYIYWIAVVPFLCVGVAAAALWLLQPPRRDVLRTALAGAVAVALLLFLAEGSAARLGGLRTAPDASSYDRLAAAIDDHVPAGARVVGATSLWWGMREADYRSYFLLFYLTRPGPYRTTIGAFLDAFDAEYVVLTRYAASELDTKLSPQDLADWRAYLERHGRKVARLEGPVAAAYGYVDIWRLD